MTTKEQVIQLCKDLRLPSMRKMVKEEIEFTHPEQAITLLHQVLVQERMTDLFERSKPDSRSEFSTKKLLEELTEYVLPPQARQKIPHLKQLGFIKEGQNVILTGSPGTGNTHISIGLGMETCLAGYKVFFTTVPSLSLINQLKECRSDRTLGAFELKFEKYDLVIINLGIFLLVLASIVPQSLR